MDYYERPRRDGDDLCKLAERFNINDEVNHNLRNLTIPGFLWDRYTHGLAMWDAAIHGEWLNYVIRFFNDGGAF